MKIWQLAVIAAAVLLIGVGVVWWMPKAMVSASDSPWLGVVLFGFMVVPPLLTVGVVLAVDRLGRSRVFCIQEM